LRRESSLEPPKVDAVRKIKAGDHLPLVWQHDVNSPLNFVGEVIDADESDEGCASAPGSTRR
jgi:hypothetical protein